MKSQNRNKEESRVLISKQASHLTRLKDKQHICGILFVETGFSKIFKADCRAYIYLHVTLSKVKDSCAVFHRKTTDVPDYYREEGEMVVPAYGYFIRGAQTTFSGVLRSVLKH